MDGDGVAISTDLDVLVNARRFHHISAAGAFRLDDLHDCMRRQRFLAYTMGTHVVPPPSSAHKAPLVEVPVLLHGVLAVVAMEGHGVIRIDRHRFEPFHTGTDFATLQAFDPTTVAKALRVILRFDGTGTIFTADFIDHRLRKQLPYFFYGHWDFCFQITVLEDRAHHDDN